MSSEKQDYGTKGQKYQYSLFLKIRRSSSFWTVSHLLKGISPEDPLSIFIGELLKVAWGVPPSCLFLLAESTDWIALPSVADEESEGEGELCYSLVCGLRQLTWPCLVAMGPSWTVHLCKACLWQLGMKQWGFYLEIALRCLCGGKKKKGKKGDNKTRTEFALGVVKKKMNIWR